jgi:hypothetical protein
MVRASNAPNMLEMFKHINAEVSRPLSQATERGSIDVQNMLDA